MLPHNSACLLAWCLIINHAYWCIASLGAMPSGVEPQHKPCQLAWHLFIGNVFWSIATTINILLVEFRWKKGGYKSGATCKEVPLYQTCLMVHCHSCTMQLYQTGMLGSWIHLRVFAKCCSIKQGIWSVANPSDMPTGRIPSGNIMDAILNISNSEW